MSERTYPRASEIWEYDGRRWVVVMTRRLPLGEAVGGLSIDGRYDEGWATLQTGGEERVVAVPELRANGRRIRTLAEECEDLARAWEDLLFRVAEAVVRSRLVRRLLRVLARVAALDRG